ncbi:MAG TPA: endo alpha-1,4 polygalactosaminidase, partial [Fluviicoccus sp.]|nr:endo alpha-1,4 polygalactosaminidase [Fluviicoccus sp.]
MTLRPTLLILMLLLAACLPGKVRAEALPSVALYYGDNPPLAELRAFDVAVVDPDHVPDTARFPHPGSTLFAYVSIGEAHPDRPWFKAIPDGVLAGNNRVWGSRLADPANPAWPDFLLERVFAPLWRQGYRGFFLDTVDSYRLLGGDAADLARREAALAALIRTVHRRWPEARLIMNRGFEILPAVHDAVWMVAAESLYRGWDNRARRFVNVPDSDRQWLAQQLDTARRTYGKPVLVIDYVPAADRRLARETARRLREEGYIPWVSTPELDQLG